MPTFNPFLTSELQVVEAGHAIIDSSWKHFAHFFPYYRMYFIKSGNARFFMNDDVLDLEPNYLYFIPHFSITGAECDNRLDHYWVHFTVDKTTSSNIAVFPPALKVKALDFDEQLFSLLLEHFDKAPIEVNNLSHSIAYQSIVKYFFSRFLENNNPHKNNIEFVPVLEYIDQHITSNISNADLSKIMCLNKVYFSNSFTKKFGVSPKQYVLNKKIGSAARMLVETDKSIKEVAFYFGYDNEMYFNRIFHKITGLTPGKYRKTFK